MSFPLSDAKEFVVLQNDVDTIDRDLFTLGRDLFYKFRDKGFSFSNTDPRCAHYTVLKDLDYSGLTNDDSKKFLKIKCLVESLESKIAVIRGHKYLKWTESNTSFSLALREYLKKGPVAKRGFAQDYDVFVFIRDVSSLIIEFYERENDDEVLSDFVLTQAKRNKVLGLSEQLFNELRDMPDVVADDSQMQIRDSLEGFIDGLKKLDSVGLAAKKKHEKLNREILIKELSSWFHEFYDDIPVGMITHIVSIIDPEITERKVYEVAGKIRPFLQQQKANNFRC